MWLIDVVHVVALLCQALLHVCDADVNQVPNHGELNGWHPDASRHMHAAGKAVKLMQLSPAAALILVGAVIITPRSGLLFVSGMEGECHSQTDRCAVTPSYASQQGYSTYCSRLRAGLGSGATARCS